MGLFGSKPKTPVININVPKLPTAEEIFQQALAINRDNFPLSLEAREGALMDIATPESTTAFFSGFQPTSFEEVLANRFFESQVDDVEKAIKQNLSLAGTINSPLLAEQVGAARGDLGLDIGQFLSNQANSRALLSLSERLGIDPNQVLAPFVNTQMAQSNAQANMDFQASLMKAQNDLQREIEKQQQGSGFISSIGSILGGGAGLILGGPSGAALGAGLGGAGASIFGGGQSPISFGDALSLSKILTGKGSSGTAEKVFDFNEAPKLPTNRIEDLFKGFPTFEPFQVSPAILN